MKFVYRYILLTIILLSCSSEDKTPIIEDPSLGEPTVIRNIDEEFLPYVDSFLNEMESRGLDLKNENLTVVFVDRITDQTEDRFCGYGWSNFLGDGARVEIVNSNRCWDQWGDIQKENLMYHEFGHALLNKQHFSDYLPNGSPESLMCSSDFCNNYRTYNKYQIDQRSYYLDQLRNTRTPAPEWATKKELSGMRYNETFDNSNDAWETSIENDASNTPPYTFALSDHNLVTQPKALAINSIAHSDDTAYATWHKDFLIANFETCSNLLVRSDIFTKNLTEGTVGVIVDLYDDADEVFDRFYKYYSDHYTEDAFYENSEVNVVCIPQETKYIRVRFYLRTPLQASVYFDNLKIELYE